MQFVQPVAGVYHQTQVSPQRYRIAGDIDDLFRLHTSEQIADLGTNSRSRRVHHHEVRSFALEDRLPEEVYRCCCDSTLAPATKASREIVCCCLHGNYFVEALS
jgi:hypothetical protein